jgi:hypothetical protein
LPVLCCLRLPCKQSARFDALAFFHSPKAATPAASRASCLGYGGFCSVGGGNGKPMSSVRNVRLSLSILWCERWVK